MTEAKTCSRCHEAKPMVLFHRNKSKPGGYGAWCKACRDKRNKESVQKFDDRDKGRLERLLRPHDTKCKPCSGTGERVIPGGACNCVFCLGTGLRRIG